MQERDPDDVQQAKRGIREIRSGARRLGVLNEWGGIGGEIVADIECLIEELIAEIGFTVGHRGDREILREED